MCKSRQTWLVYRVVGPSRRVREIQSKAWVEWMNFCIMFWILNPEFIYECRSNSTPSLHWGLSCSTWRLERAGMARLKSNGQRKLKLEVFFSCATLGQGGSYWSFVMCAEQECCIKDQLAVDHNKRVKLSLSWRTQRKSVAILCPLIFWNVILSVTTKWWTNPNAGLATQNSF